MAHGLGGTRDAGLPPYAERFAAAGMKVLLFDYRHFGDSAGEPRQLLDIGRELDDWRAAIAFARGLDGVDPERVAIWSTSFGGGHVIMIAAEDGRLGAAVSQVPMADGLATARLIEPRRMAWGAWMGLRDQLARIRGREPVYMAMTAPAGGLAAMTTDDAHGGYARIVPRGSKWENRMAARLMLSFASYRPVRKASRIRCPLLVCVCDRDGVTPPEPAARAGREAPKGEVRHYGGGHFDIYVGELFERSVADQSAFLTRNLQAT
jgi:pimeloyl-ACP methyl ester carboxylesterase